MKMPRIWPYLLCLVVFLAAGVFAAIRHSALVPGQTDAAFFAANIGSVVTGGILSWAMATDESRWGWFGGFLFYVFAESTALGVAGMAVGLGMPERIELFLIFPVALVGTIVFALIRNRAHPIPPQGPLSSYPKTAHPGGMPPWPRPDRGEWFLIRKPSREPPQV